MRYLLALGWTTWVVAGCGPAEPTAGSAGPDEAATAPTPQYVCHRADGPIELDGALDDAAWQRVPWTPVFADLTTGAAPRHATRAKALWDETYLYLAYDFADPNVWGDCIGRDLMMYTQGYSEPIAKFFCDPDGDGRDYVEFHVNPLNNVMDCWFDVVINVNAQKALGLGPPAGRAENYHIDWRCDGMIHRVRVLGTLNDPFDVDQGWTVELALPWADLKRFAGAKACPPNEGDAWKVHLARRYRANRQAHPKDDVSYWAWPPAGEESCHRIDRWGEFVFAGPPPSFDASDLPRARFQWKALWAGRRHVRSAQDARDLVAWAKRIGFNALLFNAVSTNGRVCAYRSDLLPLDKGVTIDPLGELVKAGKAEGIEVYAWVVYLYNSGIDTLYRQHPEYYQVLRPGEEARLGEPSPNPDRGYALSAPCLCPDRGLLDYEKQLTQEILRKYDVAGIAADYVGYRNFTACYCDFSNRQRLAYAKEHNIPVPLRRQLALHGHAEASLVRWFAELRAAVNEVRPNAKIAMHMYPDYAPNPDVAARFDVDYCGRTVAWLFKPFWSYAKIDAKVRAFAAADAKHGPPARPGGADGANGEGPRRTFVPFIGVERRTLLKSPERLRREIRIAGAHGGGRIMIAFAKTLRDHPELARVVAEELGGSAETPSPSGAQADPTKPN